MIHILLLTAVIQVYCQQNYIVPLLGYGKEGESYTVDVLFQFVNPHVGVATADFEDGTSVNIAANRAWNHTLTIDQTELPVQSRIMNKTWAITTTVDVDLQVITTINGHSEGVQAIPNDELGTEYYVSTMCAFDGYCQMVIGSTMPGTTLVYVKLPAAVDEVGFCIVNGTWYSSSDTTITLEYPEVVQIETTHDLTGTRVYANNTVVVTAGSRTETGSSPMFHLAEQLVPVPVWGNEYYVRAIGTTTYGNIVHITSHKPRTYVTMDGFPTVELTGSGQTIKRRIEQNTAIRIKASQPVQVMLYTGFTHWTNETITNPGMTLVPAVEHNRSSYRLACQNGDASDVIQVVRKASSTVTLLKSATNTPATVSERVPYKAYIIEEFSPGIGQYDDYGLTASPGAVGIMSCQGSAIYPISRLQKSATAACVATPDGGSYSLDTVDNDCDGDTDEDYCYEDKMFATSYRIDEKIFVGEAPRNESIVDFTVIKLRLRSCGDVRVDLVATDPYDRPGKFVFSVAKERVVIYACFPHCSFHRYSNSTSSLGNADCSTLVPYWLVRTQSQMMCMDSGHFPDNNCDNTALHFDVTNYVFTEMVMHGLYSNAVFYYDIYRSDCGGLYSDWRCADTISNCMEYQDDLCTNASFTDWVNARCRKYCGLCTPDSAGKMFLVMPPKDSTNRALEVEYTLLPTASAKAYYTSWNGETSSSFSSLRAGTKDGGMRTVLRKTVPYGGTRYVHVIHSCTPAHLTATAKTAQDAMSIPVYPLDALGTEYMTLSFSENAICDIIADGAADFTIFTATTAVPGDILEQYAYESITLSSTDYIGKVIKTSKPVAVFCFYLDSANPANNYWTQLMPTSSWGTMYIIPALNVTSPSAAFTATARILTNRANTRVEISGNFMSVYILDKRGDYLDEASLDPGVSYTITSNTPIAVAVLYTETNTGAKSVLTPPAVDNYMDSAVIYHEGLPWRVDVSVVKSDSSHVTESAVPDAGKRLLYDTSTDGAFAMSVHNDFSSPVVGVEVYNHPVHQSGQLVKDLDMHKICRISKGTPGDGVDNDCDGISDEEVTCYTGYGSKNPDGDADGADGEDCSSSTPVSPAVSPPAIPVCSAVLIPDNETYCSAKCPCIWVDTLNEYNNMTQAEKDAANMEKIRQYITLLRIDEALLTATKAEKESADDSRTSSQNIGITGIVMLVLVCFLIVFFDFINVVKFIKMKRQTASQTG